jgi:hypothetical protein
MSFCPLRRRDVQVWQSSHRRSCISKNLWRLVDRHWEGTNKSRSQTRFRPMSFYHPPASGLGARRWNGRHHLRLSSPQLTVSSTLPLPFDSRKRQIQSLPMTSFPPHARQSLTHHRLHHKSTNQPTTNHNAPSKTVSDHHPQSKRHKTPHR